MKTGRNEKCPCGSGKKFKNCCLKNLEYNFIIGKDIFEKDIRPLYDTFKNPINSVIEFKIDLPFQMALEDKFLCSFKMSDCILHYLYRTEIIKKTIHGLDNIPIEKYHTSVIMAISYNSDTSVENLESYFFDYALEELNKQIIAYISQTKDEMCYKVTKEMFSPIILMNSVNLREFKSEKSLFNLHLNFSTKKNPINIKNVRECFRLYSIYNENQNPFIHAETYALKAFRKFKEGFYDDAIISIQTNIEIIIKIVYKEVLIALDFTATDIEKKLENESLISIVKRQLPRYIGGTWDLTKEGTEVNSWYTTTYKMRNKIVHGGYYPSFNETKDAIDKAVEFRKFIFDRIKANKTKYSILDDYII
jgi:putative uncharacterized protein SCO4630